MGKVLKRLIVILLLVFILLYGYKWYTTPVFYPVYNDGEVSRIIVTEQSTGDELNIVNPDDINNIVGILSGAKLTVMAPGLITPEDSYKLTLYNENNLEIVSFNPIIVPDNESLQREPVRYSLETEKKLYDEITKLFVSAER